MPVGVLGLTVSVDVVESGCADTSAAIAAVKFGRSWRGSLLGFCSFGPSIPDPRSDAAWRLRAGCECCTDGGARDVAEVLSVAVKLVDGGGDALWVPVWSQGADEEGKCAACLLLLCGAHRFASRVTRGWMEEGVTTGG